MAGSLLTWVFPTVIHTRTYARNIILSDALPLNLNILIPKYPAPSEVEWNCLHLANCIYSAIHEDVIKRKYFPRSTSTSTSKSFIDTNIHEHNNNIHVIMLCLETLIKVYTYRLRYWPFVRLTTGLRWISLTKASDVELWCFLWTVHKQTVKQTIETPVIRDTINYFIIHHI